MDRKAFLKYAALGTAGASLPLTARSENRSLIPVPDNTADIKITDVKGYRFRKAHFVKIETDAGISGWGESDGANKLYANDYLKKGLKKYIVGKNPFDSEGIWHECYLKGLEAGIGGIHPGTLSGVDSALWDLKGKILKMPVHKLLGGNGLEKIQVYGSYGRFQGDRYQTPLEMAKIAADFVGQGYKAVKARMQIRQENVNPYPDDIFECVKEIRSAIGDNIKLFVDFNNGYTPAQAVIMGKKLHEKLGIDALEEPVFQQDYTGLRQVVDALDIPVMAGEHEYNKWMMKDLITVANVDVINADVIKCGGITDCRKTASMAHAFGKQIMVHNAKPTLATGASLQLLASIPNGARFQEYAGKRLHQGYGSLYELFENYFEFEDGFLKVPETPGLGLIVNEKAMEKNGDQ
ncbi:mandelate racemase/muconate lactonizing enzyme family protein [Fulvivirga sp. M361]|uniref:mandelate racemase/muconate lactonizing enzyme family protein n=1 Tax=Fulvivirga sp. M361 TaxID=2594266 RepID=UPI00117BCB5E|nr:mandelate racemase/muconate lactonizing enzyme family protein [Fulvivirga sp. M361]TRX48565.1 mandelate racemase/muconate lactonizing enzyme family protein [Fulvivirga sp. M361]